MPTSAVCGQEARGIAWPWQERWRPNSARHQSRQPLVFRVRLPEKRACKYSALELEALKLYATDLLSLRGAQLHQLIDIDGITEICHD